MNRQTIIDLAQKIWDYHHLNHKLKKSDCLLVQGSHDLRVAERGAQLFLDGWGPLIIFSGGLGRLTDEIWDEPEADKFARIARQMGVPADRILIENQSTNTGENVHFTRRLLAENGLDPQTFILVQKPYMERRTYATFKQVWPEKEALVTSPQISLADYPTGEITLDAVIHIMLGDLQRIRLYANKGFQIPQEIPEDVWQTYETLVGLGYTNNLINEEW
jgi:uncharacterized SAM-binding protein YcdF (DUF218 family)